MPPVLTAVVGTNAELLEKVSELYINNGQKVLDMTFGLGVFWKKVNTSQIELYRNDIDPERGEYHDDFRDTRWEDSFFDCVVLDPPYASRSGSPIKASIDRGYNNRSRAFELGIFGVDKVLQFYYDGIAEAKRVVKDKGLIMIKCMDEIMGGKQYRNHISIWDYCLALGLVDEDLFVLVQSTTPTMRHTYQLHARKNNSFLWVFRKK